MYAENTKTLTKKKTPGIMVYLFIQNYFLNTEEQNTYFKRPLDSHVTQNTFPAVLSEC